MLNGENRLYFTILYTYNSIQLEYLFFDVSDALVSSFLSIHNDCIHVASQHLSNGNTIPVGRTAKTAYHTIMSAYYYRMKRE